MPSQEDIEAQQELLAAHHLTLIIFSGLPGTGKTTLARLVASIRQFGAAAKVMEGVAKKTKPAKAIQLSLYIKGGQREKAKDLSAALGPIFGNSEKSPGT